MDDEGADDGVSDEEEPRMDDDVDHEKLAMANAMLDQLPPDVVKGLLLSRPGLMDATLDGIVDLARNAQDLQVRSEARRQIEARGLELLLLSDDGQPGDATTE